MSASRRHASGDDNILARLERDGRRGTAGKSWRHMNATMAWCALGSLAVIGLIAVLASLAKENMAAHRKPIVAEANAPVGRYTDADGMSGFAPLPAAGSSPRRSAPAGADPLALTLPPTAQAPRVPPMVMLKPAAAAPSKPAVRPPASKPVAKTVPARPAPVKVAAAPPPRVVPAAAVRPKKAAPPPLPVRPEPSAIDSDVALLSAIIMHASRHAAERAQMEAQACPPGKKCAAPKATD